MPKSLLTAALPFCGSLCPDRSGFSNWCEVSLALSGLSLPSMWLTLQNGQAEALPQLLTRLSGLIGDSQGAGDLDARPSAGFNQLLAPFARFQQALQQDALNADVRIPSNYTRVQACLLNGMVLSLPAHPSLWQGSHVEQQILIW